jgi:hypothetical protein
MRWFWQSQSNFQDEAFADLARMLCGDDDAPTPWRDLIDPGALDYSLDSLRRIDDYLDLIRQVPLNQQDQVRVVLRCGAYVGEVIRRNSGAGFRWVDYKSAARDAKYVRRAGEYLGTMGVLRVDANTMCFPLAKVCKFLESGREESLEHFARVILKTTDKSQGPSEGSA